MNLTRTFAALALCASLGACAMRKDAEPASAAPPPAAEPPPPPPGAYPGSTTPAGTPSPTPPSSTEGPPGTAEKGADSLWVEFERFDREVALSTGDCATACRALGSLERAAKRVCEGAAQLGEGGRCGEATKRLREARGRVRAACTRCAGGPSTDPDAPAP
ncbi:MAG TPA: hypothetical protein VFS43_06585 [Polyangiaceae bacterium]|nr:hypothetical protein [Polyangiaceae bacterium]